MHMNIEETKAFWKEMEKCPSQPGYKCSDTQEHNHGCWLCPTACFGRKLTIKLDNNTTTK